MKDPADTKSSATGRVSNPNSASAVVQRVSNLLEMINPIDDAPCPRSETNHLHSQLAVIMWA
jgi:hypothetical protein